MTEMAHLLLAQYVKEGDTVIDATAGNGNDTLFLAQRVGQSGKVHAFDIQRQAIESTREKLVEGKLSHRVSLHHTSHMNISQIDTPIKAAVFNLGYLPGSDKRIVTQAEVTREAVSASLSLLQPGGIIVIVLYQGHVGGIEEAIAVEQLACCLPTPTYTVSKYEHHNVAKTAPYVLAIEKRTD